jgi:hypothetical protein
MSYNSGPCDEDWDPQERDVVVPSDDERMPRRERWQPNQRGELYPVRDWPELDAE